MICLAKKHIINSYNLCNQQITYFNKSLRKRDIIYLNSSAFLQIQNSNSTSFLRRTFLIYNSVIIKNKQ